MEYVTRDQLDAYNHELVSVVQVGISNLVNAKPYTDGDNQDANLLQKLISANADD